MIRGISCGASRSHRVQSIPADQAVLARQPAISCLGDGGFLTQWGKRFLGRRGRILDSEALDRHVGLGNAEAGQTDVEAGIRL